MKNEYYFEIRKGFYLLVFSKEIDMVKSCLLQIFSLSKNFNM